MFLFVGVVFSAVLPYVASSAVAFSSVIPTFVPRSDPLCASRDPSTAPKPSSNSLSGFTEDIKYDQLALTALTPTGYALTMNNTNCAFSSTRYMLYVQLNSYNPETCADLCNRYEGCDSFNIYIQRDPPQIPGPACPNPAPIAVTKCALYSEPEKASSCTNFGQHIGPVDADGEAFKIAIRGSNAYNKVSVKQVIATVTTTVTETIFAARYDRRTRTVFVESTSAEFDATTTVRIPKATLVSIGTKTVDAPADTVTVTSYNDYYTGTTTITSYIGEYIDTTTITSGEPSSATTVTVTAPGTTTVTIPGPIVTITSQAPDTTTSVLAKRHIVATQGWEDDLAVSVWSKMWLPADIASVVPRPTDQVTVTPNIVTVYASDATPTAAASTPDYDVVYPVTAPGTVTVTRTRSVPTAAATNVVYPGVNAPMKTVTVDDSYTYTGPTDVPMKTVTLRG